MFVKNNRTILLFKQLKIDIFVVVRRLFNFGFLLFCAFFLKAQNYRILPITIEGGINAVNVQNTSNFIAEYFSLSGLNVRSIPVSFSVSTPIFKGLSVAASVNFNKVSCLICEKKTANVNRTYFSTNLNGRYSISSIFNKKWRIDPYAQLGVGLTKIGEKNAPNFAINFGGGVNFNITKNIGVFLNSNIQMGFGSDVFKSLQGKKMLAQHSVGIRYLLNIKIPVEDKDKDKDGVLNDEDKCPLVSGSVKAKGCPDDDEDGIPNIEDNCPDEAGNPANDGCPGGEDTDKDGVLDVEDDCPNQKGTYENYGCPDEEEEIENDDKDGDGVLDDEDECHTQQGERVNYGCPDADDDGLIDKEDGCPNQKGSINDGGCPREYQENSYNIPRQNKATNVEYNKTHTIYFISERQHRVKRDETLLFLAKKYGTTVKKLQQINGLKSDRIKIGQVILIR